MRIFVSTFAALLVASAVSAQAPAPKTIPAPPDVAAPPADAVKAASGLLSKVLSPGTGTDHPTPADLGDDQLHRLDERRHDVRQLASCAGRPSTFPVAASSRASARACS